MGKFKDGVNAEGLIQSDMQGTLAGSFTIMPTAEAKYENIIVGYLGTTGGGFVYGYFYQCVKNPDSTYSWVLFNGSGSSIKDHELIIPTTGWVAEGDLFTVTVTLTGMTATQYPIITFTPTESTLSGIQEQMEMASHILRADPVTDGIKFYSDMIIDKEIPIVAKVM